MSGISVSFPAVRHRADLLPGFAHDIDPTVSENSEGYAGSFVLLRKNYLREVDESEYYARREELTARFSEAVYLRGEHFFEENRRVDLALKAIERRDEAAFVRLIDQSGDSSFSKLKNCYVNDLNENLPQGILLSKKINGNGGTRVHGGGFAGTVLSLVRKEESAAFLSEMQRRFGRNNAKKVRLSRYGTRHIGHLNEWNGKGDGK